MALLDLVLGRRLSSAEDKAERVGSFAGVSVFGLDALSSAADGPEAALTILIPLGVARSRLSLPITIAVSTILAIVYFSYRQTISAYPNGAGSYTVAKENLGRHVGVLGAVALLIDYTYQSVLSLISAAVVGRGPFYFVTLASILLVLCLSANTSFADFPRVCRAVAQDGFLPYSFSLRGRRLVYTEGIWVLTAMSAILLILFNGVTDKLIPLFAVGAFLAFTLSQAGMVVHWLKSKDRGARLSMMINGLGALATGVTFLIVIVTKFTEGAWLVVIVMPGLYLLMYSIRRHYDMIAAARWRSPVDTELATAERHPSDRSCGDSKCLGAKSSANRLWFFPESSDPAYQARKQTTGFCFGVELSCPSLDRGSRFAGAGVGDPGVALPESGFADLGPYLEA